MDSIRQIGKRCLRKLLRGVWGYVVGGVREMTAQQLLIYIAVTTLLLITWRIIVHRYGYLDESNYGLLIILWFVLPIYFIAFLLTGFIIWADDKIKDIVGKK